MAVRLIIYEILTQHIIIIARIRAFLRKPLGSEVRKDRTFSSPDVQAPGYQLECCDCGALHKVWLEGDTEFMQPIRPKGYCYRLRFGAQRPQPFESR